MKIIAGQNPQDISFQLNPGETLGSCAKEIAAKMHGKPVDQLKYGEWMPVLQDLIKDNGYTGIDDARLFKLQSSQDKIPDTFKIPAYALSSFQLSANPTSALGSVIQPEAKGADTVRSAQRFGNPPETSFAEAMPEDLCAFQEDSGAYVQGRVDAAMDEIEFAGGAENALMQAELGTLELSPDAYRLAELMNSEEDIGGLPENVLYDEIESEMDRRLAEYDAPEETSPAASEDEAVSDGNIDHEDSCEDEVTAEWGDDQSFPAESDQLADEAVSADTAEASVAEAQENEVALHVDADGNLFIE